MPISRILGRALRGALLAVLWASGPCGAAASAQEAPVRLWNGNPAAPHLDIVGDEPARELAPIRIVGARNGCFSGKVIVCSAGPLDSVSAKASDLQTADKRSTISASQVQVRFATGGLKSGWNVQPKAGSTFDVLNGEIQGDAVKPIAEADKYHPGVKTGRRYLPVWVTVAIPAEAPEGECAGRLAVRVGDVSRDVEIALTVLGYATGWQEQSARLYRAAADVARLGDTVGLPPARRRGPGGALRAGARRGPRWPSRPPGASSPPPGRTCPGGRDTGFSA